MTKYAIWGTEDDAHLVKMVLQGLNEGELINNVINKAAETLGRTFNACHNRWYEEHNEVFKDEIRKLKKKNKRTHNYMGPWSKREEDDMLQGVIKYVTENNSITDAIRFASKDLKRSFDSSKSRWYNTIYPNNKEYFDEIVQQHKLNKTKLTTESEEKIEIPEFKDELSLEDIKEFGDLVIKLVERNKILEAENAALKTENEELKNNENILAQQQYKEVMEAIERARRFVIEDEINGVKVNSQ